MITTVFFDLDGTLLPMEQERFVQAYIGSMVTYMAPHGYDPRLLAKTIWDGTGAMVKNDGSASNETVFWRVFEDVFGEGSRKDEPLFDSSTVPISRMSPGTAALIPAQHKPLPRSGSWVCG